MTVHPTPGNPSHLHRTIAAEMLGDRLSADHQCARWRPPIGDVPMFDEEGKLRNVHFIHEDGQKHSIKGGQHKDTHHWIKQPKKIESQTILVCEGWATGKSAFDATEYAVIVTFGKANLLSVSKW